MPRSLSEENEHQNYVHQIGMLRAHFYCSIVQISRLTFFAETQLLLLDSVYLSDHTMRLMKPDIQLNACA